MKISYHGQSTLKIQTAGYEVLIDPFIEGNPLSDLRADAQRPDAILLTHGHSDHAGDALAIAKRSGAVVVAVFELANLLEADGATAHAMSIGGAHEFPFGRVQFTQAFHGSSYEKPNGEVVYAGMPAGILFTAEGKTIYHAGDTALFGDMKMIGERRAIDVAFLPIGDNFTMGPEDAAYAAELLGARTVVPIHYNTFPAIEQDPERFRSLVASGTARILNPGESLEL